MAALSRVGEIVRRHDPDRFFTALLAPAGKRAALFTLYAFNHELARAREIAREPMMARIRLQWWREVVEGTRRRHEVAGPLGDALEAGLLHGPDLLGMIEGREMEPETLAGWCAYVRATAGGLAVTAGRALGAGELAALRDLGSAYGVAGVLRNAQARGDPALAGLGAGLAERGREWLAAGRRSGVPRTALAAALPAVLASRDLRRGSPMGRRGLPDRLAVLAAAVRGAI